MCGQEAARRLDGRGQREGVVICSLVGSWQGWVQWWVVTNADVLRGSDTDGMTSLIAHVAECNAARKSALSSTSPSRYGINNTISFFVSTPALHRPHSSTMASLQGKKDMRRADLSMCPRPPPIAHGRPPCAPIRNHATMHPAPIRSRALTSHSRALH